MTGRRRLSREIVLRLLFQFDAGQTSSPRESFTLFCENFSLREDLKEILDCDHGGFEEALPFAQELFFGVTAHLAELDGLLEKASEHWRLDRMSRVDRNVLRLALYEMLYRPDIPLKVSLNEAIDLGKNYGSEDSGAFINGVLDRIHREISQGQIQVDRPETRRDQE